MGEKYICSGALLKCSQGNKPSQLVVTPEKAIFIEGKPMANISDHKPIVNVKPFGLCVSLKNPSVKAATAAHHGVLTPQPCIPMTITPWEKGKIDVGVKVLPGVLESSCLHCAWNGLIDVVRHGQNGPGFVEKEAAEVKHVSFSCDIPKIVLTYKKGNTKKKVVLYDKDAREAESAKELETLKSGSRGNIESSGTSAGNGHGNGGGGGRVW